MDGDANTPYRASIDGLRAIAVLLVVGFHAYPNQLAGGYVGVDIFFVISGFLITGIIVSAFWSGHFSFLQFYKRRIRRIAPALALVLIATAAGGWFLLLPWSFASLGRHLFAGALFIENGLLLSEVGYFDRSAQLKPLLHLWSLSIEEQFYLIWPCALVAMLRWRRSAFTLGSTVFALSFLGNLAIVRTSQAAAFYLPFTRFWELMAGAMLATCPAPTLGARTREAMAAGGALAIVTSVVLLDPRSLFPGAWALLPVAGAVALIAAGETTWIATNIMKQPVLTGLGLISYPLYLWHWPILSLARNAALKEPTDLEKAGCLAIAVALSYATYRLVEHPVRKIDLRWRGASVLVGALLIVAATGALVFEQDGWPLRFPMRLQALTRDYRAEADMRMRVGECFLSDRVQAPAFPSSCDPIAPGRRIVLWGDSFAASLFPGLAGAVVEGSLGEFTISGCPPVFDFDSQQRHCSGVSEEIFKRIAILRPSIVILAARWALYDGRGGWGQLDSGRLVAAVARLRAAGVQSIVLVGELPIWTASVPRIAARLALRGEDMDSNASYLDLRTMVADAWVENQAKLTGAHFVSPLSAFCLDRACRLIVPGSDGVPTSYDEGHLTVAASRWFGPALASALSGL